jgi:DNA-binding beta-propeller fold protein YncE
VDPASSGSPAPLAEDVYRSEPWLRPVGPHVHGHLRAGSRPSALGVSVLIADKLNNRLIVVDDRGRIRWRFPPPGRSMPGQTLREPDDAFFSQDGRYVIATQEDRAVVSVIDVARDRIVFRYGVPGRPGIRPITFTIRTTRCRSPQESS